MSKKMSFFVYLLEYYAENKQTTADKILELWDRLNLTDFIYDMYEMYHMESIENAYADIDNLIETGKTAW